MMFKDDFSVLLVTTVIVLLVAIVAVVLLLKLRMRRRLMQCRDEIIADEERAIDHLVDLAKEKGISIEN